MTATDMQTKGKTMATRKRSSRKASVKVASQNDRPYMLVGTRVYGLHILGEREATWRHMGDVVDGTIVCRGGYKIPDSAEVLAKLNAGA